MNRDFRITVIEDSETQAFKLRLVLEQQGWHVCVVETGEAALAALNDSLPDLIIVDYNLPGMTGAQFCRRIRMNESTRGIPVLIMTGTAPSTAEIQSLESGAGDFASKAESSENLILRIRALLRKASAGPAISKAQNADFVRARILAIDDSPTYREFLNESLANRGYEIETARDGADGLDRLTKGKFDCILVDLWMPGLDGVEVCRRIAAMSKSQTNNAAVIILTGSSDQMDLNRGLESGADDFVCKSGDLSVLMARVQALMRRRFFQENNRCVVDECGAGDTETIADTPVQATVRQLAGGVAREIDSPLAILIDNLFVVKTALNSLGPEAEPYLSETSLAKLRKARAHLKEIREGLDSVRDLMFDLRRLGLQSDAGRTI